MTIRPSLLPKLAACQRYESPEDAGKAAERGTLLDKAFRNIITGAAVAWLPDTPADDIAAVEWAVQTARILAKDSHLEVNEDKLKVDVMGMTGTADLLCSEGLWSADLKTGQIRSYVEQQAAYALGFMDSHFCDSWTVYLLFADERQLGTLRFTRETATELLTDLLLHVRDENAAPTPCDYCDWCAKRWKCPQKLELVAWFLKEDPRTLDLTKYADDPEKVGALLNLTHEIAKEDGVHDMLKAGALANVIAGREVPGWKAQAGRKTESVAAIHLAEIVEKLGAQRVLALLNNVSVAKFKELWTQAKDSTPIPDGIIQTNHGGAFLVKDKSKKNNKPTN